jgi:hypothetical protein
VSEAGRRRQTRLRVLPAHLQLPRSRVSARFAGLASILRWRRGAEEGGLNVSGTPQGPPPAGWPTRVTATAWDALALKFFDGLRFCSSRKRVLDGRQYKFRGVSDLAWCLTAHHARRSGKSRMDPQFTLDERFAGKRASNARTLGIKLGAWNGHSSLARGDGLRPVRRRTGLRVAKVHPIESQGAAARSLGARTRADTPRSAPAMQTPSASGLGPFASSGEGVFDPRGAMVYACPSAPYARRSKNAFSIERRRS